MHIGTLNYPSDLQTSFNPVFTSFDRPLAAPNGLSVPQTFTHGVGRPQRRLFSGPWCVDAYGLSLLQRRWVKFVPHVVDTALLSSAVALAILSSQYPVAQAWLSAKVLALLAYIALGTIALKRGQTKAIRGAAFIAAVLVFIYIAHVAITKNPWVFVGR